MKINIEIKEKKKQISYMTLLNHSLKWARDFDIANKFTGRLTTEVTFQLVKVRNDKCRLAK